MVNKKGKVKKKIKKRTTKNNSHVRLKLNIEKLVLFILGIIITIIGLVIMGLKWTLLLVFGTSFIIIISYLLHKLARKKWIRILFNIFIILFLISSIAGVIGISMFAKMIIKEGNTLFDLSKLDKTETSVIYDNKGQIISELGVLNGNQAEKREIIDYEEASEVLINAIIATEDARYFQHNGLDVPRFAKAAFGQLLGKPDAGGGSTLTMQVIKNSFTSTTSSGWEGIKRKFTDVYLSVFKLEEIFDKKEIFEYYINNHFLGSGSYGVEQASQTYFGKSAAELNLAEAALIAGMFQAPTSYNPFTNPDAAAIRRSTVLNLMYKHGYITNEERDIANSIPVESLIVDYKGNTYAYQSYIDTVVEEVINKFGVNPYNVPLKIYTNMDIERQAAIDDIFNGVTFKWENNKVQAGLAVIDVWTGKIVAIGAGQNRNSARQYNYATMIKRQVGSTAKPIFDYAPGMEYLGWSTYTIFNDEQYYYSTGQEIRNSDRTWLGELSLRTSLSLSRNVTALKAFQEVSASIGVNEHKKFVESFGITPESYLHEAHSIGAFTGASPLEMAAAYAVFANGGTYYEPYSVSKIEFRETGEVKEFSSVGVKVISDTTAYMITDCLITAATIGTGTRGNVPGYNLAIKTGTTNLDASIANKYGYSTDIRDGWIVGYDQDYAMGLWYGYDKLDETTEMTLTSIYSYNGPLFKASVKAIMEKGNKFNVPRSLIKVAVEKDSNPAMLPSKNTPEDQITYEYFKTGTEPTEVSTKYTSLDNVTNLNVTYDVALSTINMTWTKATSTIELSEAEIKKYGKFGYKIYKDNKLIGFTTDDFYVISSVTNPEGVYKVVTTYESFANVDSSGVTYNLQDIASYKFNLTIADTSNYLIGDKLLDYDVSPSTSDIKVYRNDVDISNDVSVTITTIDKDEKIVDLSTEKAGTYVTKYVINYNSVYVGTLYRTIIIE